MTTATTPFLDCLARAVEAKALKPAQFEKAKARFENLRNEYTAKGMTPTDAAMKAAEDATEQFAIENREAKRRKVNQLTASITAWRDMDSWKGEKKWTSWRAFFDGPFDEAPFENYSRIKEAVLGQLHAGLHSLISTYRPRMAGLVHPTKGLENILREVFGEDTGDANAKQLAKAWTETQKIALKMFRMVGGSARELENWHVPQQQDYLKLQKAGEKSWIEDHLGWLDWDKTRRSDGKLLTTVDERRAFLKEAYRTLLTDGANHIRFGEGRAVGSVGNKLDAHRAMHFKSADAWLGMNGKYGSGSVFDIMLEHVEDMAHEIALVKRFGPSPATTIRNMAAMIQKLAPTPGEAVDQVRAMDAVFSSVMRETGLAQTNRVGNVLAGTRNLLTAALLGSAPLIAVPSDINLALIAKHFNNLEGMRFVSRYLSLMNPANGEDRKLAVRLGFIAETVQAQNYGMRRFLGLDTSGPSWTRRVADVAMNVNLLTPHTQMARWAFGMELLGLFADNAGKTFDQLPFKTMMERHGVTAAEWDQFRTVAPFTTPDGATFLRPDDLYKPRNRASFDLMVKIKGLVLSEIKAAILTPDLISRNALIRDTDPGTFIGELGRSAAMFKNFPLTFYNLTMSRFLWNAGLSGKSALAYGGFLIASMTLLGALRTQLGNISRGEDPQDMTDPRFVFQSLVTGGGLGIMGDFFFGDHNRFGGGPITTLAGPVAQFLEDSAKLTLGNAREVVEGKNPHALRELIEYAQRYTPGSRNWWSRLIVDRLIWDALLEAVDPDAQTRFDQAARRRQRDMGTAAWWERGAKSPARAPDLSKALQ